MFRVVDHLFLRFVLPSISLGGPLLDLN